MSKELRVRVLSAAIRSLAQADLLPQPDARARGRLIPSLALRAKTPNVGFEASLGRRLCLNAGPACQSCTWLRHTRPTTRTPPPVIRTVLDSA